MELLYDFDREICRKGTGAIKFDYLKDFFSREDLTPLWVADMDFAVAPEITDALMERMRHPVYGYAGVPDSYWESIISWLDRHHSWKVAREELAYVNGVVLSLIHI